jgi:tetratricopeptide (TPR) repeat protein
MAAANLIIIQLLHAQTNQAEFLRLCWDKLTAQQKSEVFHFLYLSEQYKTFLSALRMEINLEEPFIPWSHLFSVLQKVNKLNSNMLKAMLGAQTTSPEMGRFRVEQPELVELWAKRKQTIVENYTQKKQELLNSLDFARQQGFKDQRMKVLDELKMLFPNDKEVDVAFHSEREYVARNTINKVFQKRLSQSDWFASSSDVDPKVARQLLKTARAYIKKNGDAFVVDFATMFYQFEMYSEALKIIDLSKDKSSHILWHALQIAIDGKQYARALSIIDHLRREHLNTEHSFSLMYYQALALFGLGQKSEAKQIITNIVRIRPDYRSADSLLLEWENEK